VILLLLVNVSYALTQLLLHMYPGDIIIIQTLPTSYPVCLGKPHLDGAVSHYVLHSGESLSSDSDCEYQENGLNSHTLYISQW